MALMYCWPFMSAMRGVSLVTTRRVVKADYGWTFGHLDVTNSLLSNTIVTRVAKTSVKKIYITTFYYFIYAYLPTHFSTSFSPRNKRFS